MDGVDGGSAWAASIVWWGTMMAIVHKSGAMWATTFVNSHATIRLNQCDDRAACVDLSDMTLSIRPSVPASALRTWPSATTEPSSTATTEATGSPWTTGEARARMAMPKLSAVG